MARPQKEGLEYFPLDVDIDQDDKLIVPIGKFGMQGFGIIVRLMAEIYKNGYFYDWGEKEQYVFARRVNVDINTINDVINECINWGFFEQKLFDDHKILTSKGFQKRYIEAAKRRKEICMIENYVLVDVEELSRKHKITIIIFNADGNKVNAFNNSDKSNITYTETPQSKVKESKVKESKVIKDLSTEIFNFRTRYPSDLLAVVDQYLEFISRTRKSNKISESVVLKIYEYLSKFSYNRIEYALRTHMSNPKYEKLKEEYTFGILRNTSEEEAESKLESLRLPVSQVGRKQFDEEAYLASLREE
ncbi:DUF4373 domain-containing protein [Paenibacillus naphthalenovorans]|uniref:DUF4373 domain-containing protein n=1 Tax=Paenibacillus naphthalenovorans TaxID=162209 RepID=UPI00088DF514|nr:DUF4373 domain-containing protein [Paenibacillus naphthalenovorans]SDJ77012.1 protein of unknown function [Paenibacillus naphthalenovorans]